MPLSLTGARQEGGGEGPLRQASTHKNQGI
jgi:hypothetical protein